MDKAEFIEMMKKQKEVFSTNSVQMGQQDAEMDAMTLTFSDLAQLYQEVDKEWREKNNIDQVDLCKRCKALVARRRGKKVEIKIEKEGDGQGIEGTYSISIVEPLADDIFEKLTGMRQESYLAGWYKAFMDILLEVNSKVGFPGIRTGF